MLDNDKYDILYRDNYIDIRECSFFYYWRGVGSKSWGCTKIIAGREGGVQKIVPYDGDRPTKIILIEPVGGL